METDPPILPGISGHGGRVTEPGFLCRDDLGAGRFPACSGPHFASGLLFLHGRAVVYWLRGVHSLQARVRKLDRCLGCSTVLSDGLVLDATGGAGLAPAAARPG